VLLKFARFVGVSIAGIALANSAWAQDVNVTTGANSAKLGGEFRAEYLYTNNGLAKTEDVTPDATSTFQLQEVNLKLNGKVNSKTEYAMRFDLVNGGYGGLKSAVDYAYGTHWLNDSVGFSMGQMKVLFGGFDVSDESYRTHAIGKYKENFVFDKYEPMFAFHVKAAGQVTLQLLNDVTVGDGGEWNQNAHPTFALGWQGKFGPIEPLFNLGTYDNQKSKWIDVGVRTDMSGLQASLDFNQNTISHKVGEDSKEDVATNISVRAGYELKGAATPWLYFSTFDVKQNADASPTGEDRKTNAFVPAGVDVPSPFGGTNTIKNPSDVYMFDDNGQVFGIGADLNMFGDGFNPYIALVNQSGKWMEGADEKTKSEMMIKIGALAEL
jgi:hypothetical protein